MLEEYVSLSEVHIGIVESSWRLVGSTFFVSPIYILIEFPLVSEVSEIDWNEAQSLFSRSEADKVGLNDWKEAFVWILAHEVRHVWQRRQGYRCNGSGKLELDADEFALTTLEKWRNCGYGKNTEVSVHTR